MKKAILAGAAVLVFSSSAALAQAVYVTPGYAEPAYVAPAPVYVAPAPVYVAPATTDGDRASSYRQTCASRYRRSPRLCSGGGGVTFTLVTR